MKKIYALILGVSLFSAYSQTAVYHENFDPPSYRDSTFNLTVNGIRAFDTTSLYSTSPPNSYLTKGYTTSGVASTPYFRTTSFSTVGHSFVVLTFNHIAKVAPPNACKIDISINNGSTWQPLPTSAYAGNSKNFSSYGFYSSSYPEWQFGNDTILPDSSWWKKETFVLNGLANDTSGTGVVGYSNVLIRFRALFSVMPPTGFSAGWFIDDIKVIGDNCETIPPKFETDYSPTPCFQPYITGSTVAQVSNSYPIGIKATDNGPFGSGIDSVAAFYQVKNNGPYGSLQTLTLQRQSSTDEYLWYFSNIYPGDTVRYYLMAVDNGCGNVTHLPDQSGGPTFNSFFVSTTHPSKCGTSLCGAPIINTFPWSQNFSQPGWASGFGTGNVGNSHRGDMPTDPSEGWSVTPPLSQNFGWSVRYGPTGTSQTGPAKDASGTNSGQYLYTEFSQGSKPKETSITTPCIDLTDSISRIFSFEYHMYGADIGNLRVDIDTGLDSASWHTHVAIIKGQQQTQSTSPWKKYLVDLTPFIGRVIKIRLVSRDSTPGDKKDVAIDNFEIRNAAQSDIAIFEAASDLSHPCGTSTNITLRAVNQGSVVATEIPLAYKLDNNTVVRDTIKGIGLALLDSAVYTFATSLNANPNVSHRLLVWAEFPQDTNTSNDTLTIPIPVKTSGVINSFPHVLDFEDATMGTSNNVNLGTPDWFLEHQGGHRWIVEEYASNDYPKGPAAGQHRGGKYLLMEKTSPFWDSVVLRSSCIDLSLLSNPQLSFEYYLENGEVFSVLIRKGNENWEPLSLPSTSGSGKDPMRLYQVSLHPYAGSIVEIMFFADQYNSGLNHSFAVDNVIIKDSAANDMSLLSIDEDLINSVAGAVTAKPFDITYGMNSGLANSMATITLEYRNICEPASPVITGHQNFTTISGLSIQGSASFSSIALSAPLTAGKYLLKVWLTAPGDVVAKNDTLTMQAIVAPYLGVPYLNSFDSCEVHFRDFGGYDQWEFFTPPGGARSGQNAAVTNGMAALPGIHELIPPIFKGLDTLLGVELRFWHKYNFSQSNEYGQVECFGGNGWVPLRSVSSGGVNDQLKYTDSAGWKYSSFPLSSGAILPNGDLYLRFKANLTTTGLSGWAIDDFEINVPPQYSVAPDQLSFVNGLPKNGNNAIRLKFSNTGRKALDSATVTVLDQNNNLLISEKVSFVPALAFQQARKITMQSLLPLNLSTTGLTVITSVPNNHMDQLPKDDTLTYQITLLPPVDSLPYCDNFETGQGMTSFDLKDGSLDTLWQHTLPQKQLISSTHSGNRAWITGTRRYPPLMNRYLYTPVMAVEGQTCYKFSFWHNYDTEYNFDGGFVEFTLDSGQTWVLLGHYNDTAWYNTLHVQSLDGILPGFSGNSSGWVQAFQEFKIFSKGHIQFRFRFASNAAINGDGWAIDDLCLEEITAGNCQEVSLYELTPKAANLNIFPNPANGVLNFTFYGEKMGNNARAEMQIFDSAGQLIQRWQPSITIGERQSVDISNIPPGVYRLNANLGGKIYVKSFVKI